MAERQPARGLVAERALQGRGFYSNTLLFTVRACAKRPQKGGYFTSTAIADALEAAGIHDGMKTGHIEYRVHHGSCANVVIEEMIRPFSELEMLLDRKNFLPHDEAVRKIALKDFEAAQQRLNEVAMGGIEKICFKELVKNLPGIPLKKIRIKTMLTAPPERTAGLERRLGRKVHPNFTLSAQQMKSSFQKRRPPRHLR
ncbi:MAG TPA: hypothetical protein HA254_03410 [Candidatus Diapherotrites archaeon]|uniref:Uncharacterized protein n=1 Tax=Candidatus Iainarchaeum sp. TaxID=3101447 RepID=A0A7J4J383_9ARCH|nr:hypothetical protein [Candidatus Diapherotrites archaeon]